MRIGYARVSTDEQTLTSQCQRLSAAGCEKLFEEKISGAARNRLKLEKLLDHLRKGDVLVVTRLDRLARSTSELLRIAERITEKNAGLQSLDEPWGKRGKTPGENNTVDHTYRGVNNIICYLSMRCPGPPPVVLILLHLRARGLPHLRPGPTPQARPAG